MGRSIRSKKGKKLRTIKRKNLDKIETIKIAILHEELKQKIAKQNNQNASAKEEKSSANSSSSLRPSHPHNDIVHSPLAQLKEDLRSFQAATSTPQPTNPFNFVHLIKQPIEHPAVELAAIKERKIRRGRERVAKMITSSSNNSSEQSKKGETEEKEANIVPTERLEQNAMTTLKLNNQHKHPTQIQNEDTAELLKRRGRRMELDKVKEEEEESSSPPLMEGISYVAIGERVRKRRSRLRREKREKNLTRTRGRLAAIAQHWDTLKEIY